MEFKESCTRISKGRRWATVEHFKQYFFKTEWMGYLSYSTTPRLQSQMNLGERDGLQTSFTDSRLSYEWSRVANVKCSVRYGEPGYSAWLWGSACIFVITLSYFRFFIVKSFSWLQCYDLIALRVLNLYMKPLHDLWQKKVVELIFTYMPIIPSCHSPQW